VTATVTVTATATVTVTVTATDHWSSHLPSSLFPAPVANVLNLFVYLLKIFKKMTLHMLFISGGEIVLVALLALLFFGSKAIPDIAKTLGKGMREFKKATNEIKREFESNTSDFKRDIDEIKYTVKEETKKISSDIETVSTKMTEETTKITHDIDKELKD
jgi:sec-independent protein translocase protein TatA